jgi:hypothetical protein
MNREIRRQPGRSLACPIVKPRRLVIAATGLLATFAMTSCTSIEKDAARVDGTRITMSEMETLSVAYGKTRTSATAQAASAPGTVDLATVRKLTGAKISIQLVEDRLARRGTPVTDAVRNTQRDTYATSDATAAQWKTFPAILQALFVESKVVDDAVTADQTLARADPNEKLWVNPVIGQFDPSKGIVAIGDPLPPTFATFAPAPSAADGSAADTTAAP